MNDVCSQGGGVCPELTFCGQEGGFQMRTSALFAAKTSDFSKYLVCPHGKEGLSRKGGLFTILYGCLLWTVPNHTFVI